MTKWIIGIAITVLVAIVGAIYFLEDRYENECDAAVTKKEVSELKKVDAEQIETLKSMQQSQQSLQRSEDLRALESLQNQKYLLEKELAEEPNNQLLQDKIRRLDKLIEKLEEKVY